MGAKKKATKKPKKAKKPKKKKAKKKKKKVVKYPGGKQPKGVHKSKASKAAGKECGGDEEEGHLSLRHQDALRRPRRDLRQEQDGPHGGGEGALGVHQRTSSTRAAPSRRTRS